MQAPLTRGSALKLGDQTPGFVSAVDVMRCISSLLWSTHNSVHWGESVDKLQRNSSCHWSLGCTRDFILPDKLFHLQFSCKCYQNPLSVVCVFVKLYSNQWNMKHSLWQPSLRNTLYNVGFTYWFTEISLPVIFIPCFWKLNERNPIRLSRKNWLIKHQVRDKKVTLMRERKN